MEKKKQIKTHEDLMVYQLAFSSAMRIFELSQKFPAEERYSLTDQIRRSSRSVCANLAEAWRKRRYQAAFIAKLSDCEAVLKDTASHKAAETQVWLKFAVKCEYLNADVGREIYSTYNQILGSLVKMIKEPDNWLLK
ncbi:MAG: four helix bundle protein [Cyanobacteria bacterium P01_G01_bin.39]